MLPFARLNGASTFGTVGACWGGYAMIRLSTYQNCKFSIGFHASQHGQLQNLYGDDYMAIYNDVKSDVFFFNSVND